MKTNVPGSVHISVIPQREQTDMDIEFNLTQAKNVTFTASYGKNFESKVATCTKDVTADGR